MSGYVEAPRAYWLTHGMARAVGVNLAGAVIEGWLTRRDLARLVTRCQTCGRSHDCQLWLATARSAPLPEFCGNKADIEALVPDDAAAMEASGRLTAAVGV